jgi:hypothetical protein
MPYMNGRQRPYNDLRTLPFGRYTRFLDDGPQTPPTGGLRPDSKLPKQSRTYHEAVTDPLGNDEYLTCVPAAMLRLNEVWSMAPDNEIQLATTNQALSIYEAISPFKRQPSGAVDPSTFSNDVEFRARTYNDYGATMLSGLRMWHRISRSDERVLSTEERNIKSFLRPAKAFLEIEPGNIRQLWDAINLGGGVLIGLSLPRSILVKGVSPDEPQEDWFLPSYGAVYDATAGSWGSHCVLAVGYSPGLLHCIGWARFFTMSYAFLGTYAQEVWCVLPHGALDGHGEFDNRLRADLDRLSTTPFTAEQAMPARTSWWGGPNIMGGGG